jgi:hypothetical protein
MLLLTGSTRLVEINRWLPVTQVQAEIKKLKPPTTTQDYIKCHICTWDILYITQLNNNNGFAPASLAHLFFVAIPSN